MKNILKSFYKFISSNFQTIHLDYKVNVVPSYGHGKAPHALLYDIINKNRAVFKKNLESFLDYSEKIHLIKPSALETDENKPTWNNKFLPGLDIISLYGIIAKHKPNKYVEIGSGHSTKVAYKAKSELKIKTNIISIDPMPRAEIDNLAGEIIREPFENLLNNGFIVELLEENDILFVDNSHRVFPNSDAMICFLELLPYLKKGVIVHFHDIYLPYDYPQFMCDRFYNEQYMLGAYILANPNKYKPILPNYFISEDSELSNIISPIWNHQNLKDVEKHGGSFWLQIC